MTIEILRRPIGRARLAALAAAQFGDMVKAVVDVERRVMAIGGDAWIEFDAMINVRPSQGNRSRTVDDPKLQDRIRTVVTALVEN